MGEWGISITKPNPLKAVVEPEIYILNV